MFDNSVKFIPNEIDTGKTKSGFYSPGIAYDSKKLGWEKTANWDAKDVEGIWANLETRSGGEMDPSLEEKLAKE